MSHNAVFVTAVSHVLSCQYIYVLCFMDFPVTSDIYLQMTSGTYLGATPGTTAAAATTTSGNGEAALLKIFMASTLHECQAEGKDVLLHIRLWQKLSGKCQNLWALRCKFPV